MADKNEDFSGYSIASVSIFYSFRNHKYFLVFLQRSMRVRWQHDQQPKKRKFYARQTRNLFGSNVDFIKNLCAGIKMITLCPRAGHAVGSGYIPFCLDSRTKRGKFAACGFCRTWQCDHRVMHLYFRGFAVGKCKWSGILEAENVTQCSEGARTSDNSPALNQHQKAIVIAQRFITDSSLFSYLLRWLFQRIREQR